MGWRLLALAIALAAAARRRPGTLAVANAVAARRRRQPSASGPGDGCRLYEQRGSRLEAHLSRRGDGRAAVVAVPLDGRRSSERFTVAGNEPWRDFERQAHLRGAAWGPCRAGNAGL